MRRGSSPPRILRYPEEDRQEIPDGAGTDGMRTRLSTRKPLISLGSHPQLPVMGFCSSGGRPPKVPDVGSRRREGVAAGAAPSPGTFGAPGPTGPSAALAEVQRAAVA